MQMPPGEVHLSTTYFDGLGRPEQTVIRQGSLVTATGAALDLVSPFEYDRYGREQNRYLPFAAAAADGLFKDSALFCKTAFICLQYRLSPGRGSGTLMRSPGRNLHPLSRVTRTLAPGNSWAGAGTGVSLSYEVNHAPDSVRLWKVTAVAGDVSRYSANAFYAPGSLYKKVTTDEAGKKVVEYQDKQGKVVLKKVQEDVLPSEGHSGWLSTYYIYDDLDRLRAVLQPLAVEAMNDSGSWTPDAAHP